MKANFYRVMLLVLFAGLIFFCRANTGNANTKIKNNKNTLKAEKDSIPITNLPFGCSILMTHKFPKEWEGTMDDLPNKEGSPNRRAFDKVSDFYYKLSRVKTINGPQIRDTKYIIVGIDSMLIQFERHFKADFKYRLPDFGPYKCYYQYCEVPMEYFYKLEDKAEAFDKLYTSY